MRDFPTPLIAPTWRFMGTSNPIFHSTVCLLRGLRGLICAVVIGVISTLNLQVRNYGFKYLHGCPTQNPTPYTTLNILPQETLTPQTETLSYRFRV